MSCLTVRMFLICRASAEEMQTHLLTLKSKALLQVSNILDGQYSFRMKHKVGSWDISACGTVPASRNEFRVLK